MAESRLSRIVVGVDVFGYAESAVNAAISLAERSDAELILVHAVPQPRALLPDHEPTDLDGARRAVQVSLEAHVSGARMLAGFGSENLVVAHARHPAELLLTVAEERSADLIMLGRHRKRGWLHPGNTVRGVLAHARCPVWVQIGPVRSLRRVLVPVDLSQESLAALTVARDWAARHEAEVVVLHCFVRPELFYGADQPAPGPTYVIDQLRQTAQEEFKKVMAAQPWGDLPHRLVFAEDEPIGRILALQDEVDLVVMGTHGHTGLAGALLGNVADGVIRNGHVPVVALRNPDREWLL